MKRLYDKVAIITGGARGIGRSAALKFAEEGAHVVIVDIDEKAGRKTAEDIGKRRQQAEFMCADVSGSGDVRDVIREVEKRQGRLNILYNNASVYLPNKDGRVVDVEDEDWDRVIAVNLRSVFLFCKHGIPLMLKSGGGSIINTASSAGIIGIPNCDAYTATKGATVALTRSLAVEYGPENIRVNCIAPAAIQTPMMRSSNLDDSSFDELRFLKLRTPLRRYGKPEEIADIALYLASDESSYINGSIIVADGGITINGDLSKIQD